eukprot:660406-Alexandrium_andersonii.AAC.1
MRPRIPAWPGAPVRTPFGGAPTSLRAMSAGTGRFAAPAALEDAAAASQHSLAAPSGSARSSQQPDA